MRHTARHLLTALTVTLGSTALIVTGAMSPAQAAPTSCEYPVAKCEGPTLALSVSQAEQGQVVEAVGAKLIADRPVTLMLRPNGTASAAARFTPDQGSAGVQRYMLTSAKTYLLTATRSYTLSTVRTDADGGFTTNVTVPKTALGKYTVVAVNGTPAGFTDPTAPLTVVRAGGGDDNHNPNNDETTTAFTGFNMLWLVLLAAVLVAIGWYANRRGKETPIRSIHG